MGRKLKILQNFDFNPIKLLSTSTEKVYEVKVLMKFLFLSLAFTFFLSSSSFSEGFGTAEATAVSSANFILRAGAQKDNTALNFLAVGRIWTGSQYKALIGSYLKTSGGQDYNFRIDSATPSKYIADLAGSGLDNLCTAAVYTDTGFIVACRSMESSGYYDTYLVKISNTGVLDSGFGTGGIKDTNLGGTSNSANAYVRGIIYDAANSVVVIAGAKGTSGGGYSPIVAKFSITNGTQSGSTTTIGGISGTAVGIAFDSGNSKYYTASVETSGNKKFYVHQFDTSLIAAGGSWGTGANGSAAISGTTYSAVPSGIAVIGTDVITVGGVKVDSSAYRCMVTAHKVSDGTLDTGFGSVNSPLSGTANTGTTLFTENTSRDCVLNSIAAPPSGTTIMPVGAVYNGSNYDFLTAKMDSSGVMDTSFDSDGIKTQAVGAADDVQNFAIWLSGSATSVYGIGRSQDSNQYNGAALSKVIVATATFSSPTSDSWSATTTTGAPLGKRFVMSAWTGSKFFVWGGGPSYVNSGGLYDPVANSWTAVTTTGAPGTRERGTAVWTGSKIVVFGGIASVSTAFNTGGQYDPTTDTWTATTTTGAPTTRRWHSAVWNGSKMLVFGGTTSSSTLLNSGGIYDPSNDTWTATTTTGAPPITSELSAFWTGTRLLVFGGGSAANGLNTGGIYNPSDDTWVATNTTSAPSGRYRFSGVYTGSKMLVWGGYSGSAYLNTGGIYDFSGNSWTAMTTTGAPAISSYRSSFWTGNKMFLWGGYDGGNQLNTGGFYNPVTDSWSSTTTTGAPTGRMYQSGIWSGSSLFINNGSSAGVNTGGIYTP